MQVSGLDRQESVPPDTHGAQNAPAAQRHGGRGDTADISAEGVGKADFYSPLWSPDGDAEFSMSAYTSNGTSVTLEARRRTFSMGKFARADGLIPGGASVRSQPNLTITFTSADGLSQTFKVTDNMRFLEDENGRVRMDDSGALPQADSQGRAATAIVVNLSDGGNLRGGDGDDVLFNLGQNAVLDGGKGDDTLLSMGDGARLLGGDGNDTLKIVRDIIRKENTAHGINMKATEANLQKAALEGFEKGQSVFMDGGDGDDVLLSEVKLHDSTILGGDGDDTLTFGTLVGSSLDAGAGDDMIRTDKLSASILRGGDGDDSIAVHTAANGSVVDGGKGDDRLSVQHVRGSGLVRGGDGEDAINVGTLKEYSMVDGGRGDDTIDVTYADHSAIQGGDGNDTVFLGSGYSAVISGGRGDDTITVGAGNGNLISGDDGDDLITAGGSLNLVDGGAGVNSIFASGTSRVTDNEQVIKNDIAAADLAGMAARLTDTLEHVDLAADRRRYYLALLRYTAQQTEGERPRVFDE